MRAVMWTLIVASGLAALALSFQGQVTLATIARNLTLRLT